MASFEFERLTPGEPFSARVSYRGECTGGASVARNRARRILARRSAGVRHNQTIVQLFLEGHGSGTAACARSAGAGTDRPNVPPRGAPAAVTLPTSRGSA